MHGLAMIEFTNWLMTAYKVDFLAKRGLHTATFFLRPFAMS
jgi:hypothetical protein